MSQNSSPTDQLTPRDSHAWVQYLPDGAVSEVATTRFPGYAFAKHKRIALHAAFRSISLPLIGC